MLTTLYPRGAAGRSATGLGESRRFEQNGIEPLARALVRRGRGDDRTRCPSGGVDVTPVWWRRRLRRKAASASRELSTATTAVGSLATCTATSPGKRTRPRPCGAPSNRARRLSRWSRKAPVFLSAPRVDEQARPFSRTSIRAGWPRAAAGSRGKPFQRPHGRIVSPQHREDRRPAVLETGEDRSTTRSGRRRAPWNTHVLGVSVHDQPRIASLSANTTRNVSVVVGGTTRARNSGRGSPRRATRRPGNLAGARHNTRRAILESRSTAVRDRGPVGPATRSAAPCSAPSAPSVVRINPRCPARGAERPVGRRGARVRERRHGRARSFFGVEVRAAPLRTSASSSSSSSASSGLDGVVLFLLDLFLELILDEFASRRSPRRCRRTGGLELTAILELLTRTQYRTHERPRTADRISSSHQAAPVLAALSRRRASWTSSSCLRSISFNGQDESPWRTSSPR